MIALVYVSTAAQLFAPAALQGMLVSFRENNARLGITGALIYHDGNFMQVIEGEAEQVAMLYRRINADPRHHDVTTILEIEQPARQFTEWSMAFRDLRDMALWTVPGYQTLTQLSSPAPAFMAHPPMTLRLMQSFVQASR